MLLVTPASCFSRVHAGKVLSGLGQVSRDSQPSLPTLSSAILREDCIPGIGHPKGKDTISWEVAMNRKQPTRAGFSFQGSLPFQSAEPRPPPPAASSPPSGKCPQEAQWWQGCPASERSKQQRYRRCPLWMQQKEVQWPVVH